MLAFLTATQAAEHLRGWTLVILWLVGFRPRSILCGKDTPQMDRSVLIFQQSLVV